MLSVLVHDELIDVKKTEKYYNSIKSARAISRIRNATWLSKQPFIQS